MTTQDSYRPYQRHVFIWLLITFLLITISLSIGIYYSRANSLFRETQETLKQVAVRVAAHIPVETHEKLINPDQLENDDYRLIESYFRSVLDGNPKIDDIYTLRPTATPHEMVFVVSGMITKDKNKNNYIEESEQKPLLGEKYNTAEFPELEKGLIKPSADNNITYDKWGAWISGYAPLTDASGKAVAVVGVDEVVDFIADQRTNVRNSILLIDLILLPFLILIAYILSKTLSRPLRVLAEGMKRVSHGDLEHYLPTKGGKDEAIFSQLFNNMLNMFRSLRKHELEKDHSKKDTEEES